MVTIRSGAVRHNYSRFAMRSGNVMDVMDCGRHRVGGFASKRYVRFLVRFANHLQMHKKLYHPNASIQNGTAILCHYGTGHANAMAQFGILTTRITVNASSSA